MSDAAFCKEKLSQNLSARSSKPYIDNNLQMQTPGWEESHDSHSNHPIYTHYVGTKPSITSLMIINESEFYRAMIEADNSFKAWQVVKKKIQNAVAQGRSSS